jgi:carbohydrate kinase (thermoresistant glucokinase family)
MAATDAEDTRHLVVMGVTGVGKSAVAGRLAEELDLAFAEGDDFHPLTNVSKMTQGIPLTDDDRWPWLESLASWTRQQAKDGRSTVLTCSALRRAYRDVLRRGAVDTFFVHLVGSEELIQRRMSDREHFMPVELLRSQLDALEPLEPDEQGAEIDVSRDIGLVVSDIVRILSRT